MREIPFTPRHKPFSHQAEFLAKNARRAHYALFWEQGTGKTKALIDNAAMLHMDGQIDGVFVLAPNGVHRNWHVEELPSHWPEDAPPLNSFSWDTTKAANISHQADFRAFLKTNKFPVLCMSYDGIMTDRGKKASWDFLRSRRAMYILDESQRIKTPKAKRTKTIIASSVYAPYRRIASGTPADTPFDMYSQVRFLDPEHWIRTVAVGSFTSFKQRFGVWVNQMGPGGREFPNCVDYKNLDEMAGSIADISSRVLKDDVLDLPPKLYKRVFHELSPAQRTAYRELREECLTILESGELVTAEMALIMQMRLTQIGCGFVIPQTGAAPVPFDPNPRAAIFGEVLQDQTGPTIIWGRFIHDVQTAARVSRSLGRRPVIYDGERPGDSMDLFHTGKADDIIANLDSSMREGYTLNEAAATLYYSNTSKLLNRLQSEDRNHRIGQLSAVTYYDFLAEGTIDKKSLDTLRGKRDPVGTVLGDNNDNARQWLLEALS